MKLHARMEGASGLSGRRRAMLAICAVALLLLVMAQLALDQRPSSAQQATLRGLASQRGLFVGAAVDANALANEATYRTVLAREYNSVTAENAMKWGVVEPNQGQFNWTQADALFSFAQANNQSVYGHTLVWHSQLPNWVSSLTGSALRTAMIDHINTEMGRYQGRVRAWDVVNEAFNEDGSFRQSPFFTQLGSGYIADAFRAARAADPSAKLFINDFNTEGMNAKSNALFNLVSSLKQQGVPIDGVGFQGHLILNSLPSGIQQNLQRFASLGVDVAFTELDIRMQLPADSTKLAQQASNYTTVLNACLAVPRCVSFTTWGFTDAHSWVPGTFSGQGAALPFNESYQPKPAYNAMIQALGGVSSTTTTSGGTTTTGATTTTTGQTTTTVPTTTGPAGSCQVAYAFQSQWQDGFVANLTIRNTGSTAFNGWTLTWTFPGNQRITNLWNANWSQTGQAVTTSSNADWNRVIAAGGQYTFGFQATYSGTNAVPTNFAVNGVACGGQATTTTAGQTTTSWATTTTGPTTTGPTTTTIGGQNPYTQRFLDLYRKIKDPANGYFSAQGIPYHSVETLIVEAPDYGHETTSEAFSYWLWLEATYGQVTGDWAPFNNAWATMERYIIPSHADQPTNSFYNPSSPATYAPENDLPSQYPSALDSSVPVGQDPLAGELQSTYGTPDIYGMHWLLDVDNRYGFGRCGDHTTKPAFINTFQRGPQESVWETIPQPDCDTFADGGPNGFLDLFIRDSSYARQWKYTDAPDADARAVQAAYWALTWATAQGKQSQISATVANAAKMGDYLRYSLFDKYFKRQGNCTDPHTCPGATGRDSADFLLGWYYAWGGANDTNAGWAWRIGDGVAHFGYQNPLAAWAMSNVSALRPRSPTAASDWSTSLTRQLQFYQWLQSAEGGIAGGAANSWGGHYGVPPAGDPTFFGMAYDFQPVYHDPPSNEWFGFQAWSMERVAEYYYANPNDTRAKALLDKWVSWALANTTVNSGGTFSIPSKMTWSGQPAASFSGTGTPAANPGLHVTILESGQDVGVAGALAKTLAFYAARSGSPTAKSTAKALLDALASSNYQDAKGVSSSEARSDYNRFDDPVFVPAGWTGRMPNGDPINSQSTFTSIRSWYQSDPDWSKVQTYLNGGAAPTFRYHRFWAQADIATAQATYGILFPAG